MSEFKASWIVGKATNGKSGCELQWPSTASDHAMGLVVLLLDDIHPQEIRAFGQHDMAHGPKVCSTNLSRYKTCMGAPNPERKDCSRRC